MPLPPPLFFSSHCQGSSPFVLFQRGFETLASVVAPALETFHSPLAALSAPTTTQNQKKRGRGGAGSGRGADRAREFVRTVWTSNAPDTRKLNLQFRAVVLRL